MNSLRVRLAELPDNYFQFFRTPKVLYAHAQLPKFIQNSKWPAKESKRIYKTPSLQSKVERVFCSCKGICCAKVNFIIKNKKNYGHSYIRFVQTYWYSALHSPQSTIILFNASKTLVDAQSVPAVRFHSLREASLKCSELPASLIIRHFKKL